MKQKLRISDNSWQNILWWSGTFQGIIKPRFATALSDTSIDSDILNSFLHSLASLEYKCWIAYNSYNAM